MTLVSYPDALPYILNYTAMVAALGLYERGARVVFKGAP